MDRVMQEYWSGNLDASGSFFEGSTSYTILKESGSGFGRKPDYDFEYESRFYLPRDFSKTKPHKYAFMVVRNSMKTRYFFEMAFFFTLTMFF